MRLLWMKSDYVVPPNTGGKIRTYNLLRELNHLCDVTYLSFKDTRTPNDEPEIRGCASQVVTVFRPEETKQGAGFYRRVLRGMLSSEPYILQKYRSAEIIKHQRHFHESAIASGSGSSTPIIVCDFLEMAENVDWSLPCPKVLFQHNVESIIWQRYFETEKNPLKKAYFNFERKRMANYERDACNRFDLVFTVSEEDKDRLRGEFGVTRPIEVLETGVDTEYFAPRIGTLDQPGRLVFLGSLDWMPNIDGVRWFVTEVYPLIKAARPEVTLDIVGRRPPEAIRRYARDASIRVIADVPDVRPYLARADVFVVPLRIGGGSRIKIYEAMAMRRPVVSTTIGAEGLPVQADRHLVMGDTAGEFSSQVVRLLEEPSLKDSIATHGYEHVTENYQWKNIAQLLHARCLELTQTQQLISIT